MIVFGGPNLCPLNATTRGVDDSLIILDSPLLSGEIIFHTRVYQPERYVMSMSKVLPDLIDPPFLLVTEIEMGTVGRQLQWNTQMFAKITRVTCQKRNQQLVGAVND